MGKAAAARKLASAAAFGGGGLSVLGMGLYAVLRGEAALARRMIGNAGDEPPPDSRSRRTPSPRWRTDCDGRTWWVTSLAPTRITTRSGSLASARSI